ncbi:MAG TPA: TetR/AcrR family transcriptional regulator [Solirubrobacteraceae bacterium]|jgi:AcrR family transcriptional regulator
MAGPATRTKTARAAARSTKKTNRQAEVTQAAIEIFWQKGYRAASIQDVAEKVGVLKGSLYYYIESKEDLLWRIIEDVHHEWSEILEQAGQLEAGPIDRIHAFIKLHIEWYLRNMKEVSVFFREWQHLGGDRLRTVKDRRRRYEQVIRDLIAAAQEAGDVSAELNLQYASRYVLAAVNAVPDWYRPASGDSPAKVADAYADMTIGLLTGTPRPAPKKARKTS